MHGTSSASSVEIRSAADELWNRRRTSRPGRWWHRRASCEMRRGSLPSRNATTLALHRGPIPSSLSLVVTFEPVADRSTSRFSTDDVDPFAFVNTSARKMRDMEEGSPVNG